MSVEINMSSTSHKGEKTRSYTVDFELEVVTFVEDNSIHVAERKFKADWYSIRDWKRSEENNWRC